jgi:hypothetical protein
MNRKIALYRQKSMYSLPLWISIVFLIILTEGCLQKTEEQTQLPTPTQTIKPVQPIEPVDNGYTIFLTSRQFVPSLGIDQITKSNITTSKLNRVHILIQFYRVLNNSEKKTLEEAGVKILSPIQNVTWFASIQSDSLEKILQFSFLRWIGEVLPEDKIEPKIIKEGVSFWAINPDGTIKLKIKFFEDIPENKAREILGKYAKEIQGPELLNYWTIITEDENILEIAKEDEVQWIDETSPPPTTFGEKATKRSNQ